MIKHKKKISLAFYLCLLAIGLAFFFILKYKNAYLRRYEVLPSGDIVFVDQSNISQNQNGSVDWPFSSISAAISFIEKRPEFRKIAVYNGTYKETISVPEKTGIFAQGTEVKIENPNPKTKTTVQLMGDNTLYGLKISGGRYGIWIKPDSNFLISRTDVSNAGWYGVYSEIDDSPDPAKMIKITRSKIHGNGLQGIYVQKGHFEISDSLIENNGEEGIDLHFGMVSKIKNNIIRNNGEGGIETEIDDNTLSVENNLIEGNGASGIKLQTGLSAGAIYIANNVIRNNLNYGIDCAIHAKVVFPFFKKVITRSDNTFSDNIKGAVAEECEW